MAADPHLFVQDLYDRVLSRYFPLPDPPPDVWHYSGLAVCEAILANNCLHASNVHDMSDPTELYYAIQLLNDGLATVRYHYHRAARYCPEDFVQHILETIQKRDTRQFVVCLSVAAEASDLWSRFAPSEGGAIVFRIPDLIEALRHKRLRLLQDGAFEFSSFSLFYGLVLYDKDRQRRLLHQLLRAFLQLSEAQIDARRTGIAAPAIDRAVMEMLYVIYGSLHCMKPPEYAPEAEYRIILIPDKAFRGVELKPCGPRTTRYVQVHGDPLPLCQVVVGPSVDPSGSHRRLASIADGVGRLDITVRKSAIHTK
jgi:hypothetical protein